MAEEKETPESLSPVSLTRNAKGYTQITVKIYDEDPDKASEKAEEIYKTLCTNHND